MAYQIRRGYFSQNQDHMHRFASGCNCFCTKKKQHRTICTASHQDHMHRISSGSHEPLRNGDRIASVCNQTDPFCANKNSIGPYAPDRIGVTADHINRVASSYTMWETTFPRNGHAG